MRDPVVQIPQQFDRAGSPIDQASAWSDARLQALSPSGDDDCRHRTHASGQKGSVQTRDAWHQKQNRSRDLECGAFRVIRVKLQAPARLNFQSLHQSPSGDRNLEADIRFRIASWRLTTRAAEWARRLNVR